MKSSLDERVDIDFIFSLQAFTKCFCKPDTVLGPSNAEGMRCGHLLREFLVQQEKLTC